MSTDHTHDPELRSWIESANDPKTDFPIQNLPLCRFQRDEASLASEVGVAIGDRIISITALWSACLLDDLDPAGSGEEEPHWPALDSFVNASPRWRRALRSRLSELFRIDNHSLRDNAHLLNAAMLYARDVRFLVPARCGSYTDFYASIHHARTVGGMFRPDNPLLPNYKHVPIGYHGRASSIVPTDTPVRRPCGQQSPPESEPGASPTFGPCKMLDYELEVGCIIAGNNALGVPTPIEAAGERIAGLCLVNDWSARDVQKWEYQPLGPFLAKNFATTVSPFLVTREALEPFRCSASDRPAGDPRPLAYLNDPADQSGGGFDITLEVQMQSAQMAQRGMAPITVSRSNAFRDMYWTFAQMIAHHTSGGCNLEAGDLIASGTVSGPEASTRGCLLELTWDGPGKPRKPIQLPSGETRSFLADGDTVTMRAWCERPGLRRIGFGECRGTITAT